MSDKFYPQSGPELAIFIDSLLAFATANLLALGLVPADLALLTASQNEFKDSLLAQTNGSNAYDLLTEQRYISQSAVIDDLSAFNTLVQASPTITDPQREGMGLPVYDTTLTPVPVPLTRPVLQIDTSQRLQHTISFSDEATPESRKKPDGVRSCQIWHKIGGPAPLDVTECSYVADDTAPPYLAAFAGSDAGKTVYYMAAWTNPKGTRGPWSTIVNATITG